MTWFFEEMVAVSQPDSAKLVELGYGNGGFNEIKHLFRYKVIKRNSLLGLLKEN
jgi:SAM-dependent MidA family methyltransferase